MLLESAQYIIEAMTRHILTHIDNLNPDDFLSLADADTGAVIGAQAATAHELLRQMGSPEHILQEDQAAQVREVFGKMNTLDLGSKESKAAVLTLRVPEAVRHLAGMLSAYDWEYVEQAKQLRGYVVAKLLEETKHPDAKIRLRALELTGRLTEVASFTDRIEIKKVDMSDAEIDAKIKEKLNRFMGVLDVVDITDTLPDHPERNDAT